MLSSTHKSLIVWSLIAIGTFSAIIALLQNVMLTLFIPKDKLEQQFNSVTYLDTSPDIFNLLFTYFDYFLLFAVIAALITFLSSFALLIPKKSVKKVFIGLMSFAILWDVGSFLLQLIFFNTLPESPDMAFAELQTMQNIIFGSAFAMSLAFTALFLWILFKLRSKNVLRIFTQTT